MTDREMDGMDPTALSVEQVARLLGVNIDVIRRHITEGLPTGRGGTVNLISYAAWLNLDRENET